MSEDFDDLESAESALNETANEIANTGYDVVLVLGWYDDGLGTGNMLIGSAGPIVGLPEMARIFLERWESMKQTEEEGDEEEGDEE